jgi:hypothetical protein
LLKNAFIIFSVHYANGNANNEEVKDLRRKLILICPLVILMMIMFIAPVLACGERQHQRGTFEQGILQYNTSPGTQWTTGNILHMKNGTSISYVYGSPWGNSLSGTGKTISFELDTVSLKGNSVSTAVDTYAGGTVKGMVFANMNGTGPYTYLGPTFSFTLDGKTGIVTHGATYIGALINGFAVKHGTDGNLKGLWTWETFTGVNVKVGPLAGVIIIDNTVDYKLP